MYEEFSIGYIGLIEWGFFFKSFVKCYNGYYYESDTDSIIFVALELTDFVSNKKKKNKLP